MTSKLSIWLLAFGFINTVNSEERVDMICKSDTTYAVESQEYINADSLEHSLVIFPKSQRYIYDENTGLYKIENNTITYTICLTNNPCNGKNRKSDYSVDRITGAFKEHWQWNIELGLELISTGKCRKAKRLF